MIPLRIRKSMYKDLDISNQKEYLDYLCEAHYQYVLHNMQKFNKVNKWIIQESILIKGKQYDFESIIKAKPSELRNLKAIIDLRIAKNTNYWKNYNDVRKKHVHISQLKSIVSWYTNRIDKYEFTSNLGLTVCPYCNRNYITTGVKGKTNRVTSHIEHFFSKSTYPLFALSFYNLMPVCPSCNSLKSEDMLNVSVYDIENSDDYLRFKIIPKKIGFMTSINSFDLKLEYSDEFAPNVESLCLESLYTSHKDYVLEIMNKKSIYTDGLLSELYEKHEGLFSSTEETRRILYGNYVNEKDIHKRPLAKLTKDIYCDLDVHRK